MHYHTPVLLERSIELLDIRPDGTYLDLTFGGGGHSALLLDRLAKKGRLIAFDQDIDAQANKLEDRRFQLIHNNFRFVRPITKAMGIAQVDGIIADLGVSSHHFDTPGRGFSFRFADQTLDMRMNQNARLSALDIVNNYELDHLATLLGRFGEVDKPYKIAKAIIDLRPITTTSELERAVEPHIPQAIRTKTLSKIYQAIRIEVNGEIEALQMMLYGAYQALKIGGVMSIISYHSLEDRLVKNYFKSGNFDGSVEKDFYGNSSAPFELLTRKAIEPSAQEIAINPRSRSAKLRAAKKL